MMRENITSGDIPFRKADIQGVVSGRGRGQIGQNHRNQGGHPPGAKLATKNFGPVFAVLNGNGAPDRIRTCDLWNRNPTLYPAELRVHAEGGLNRLSDGWFLA